MVVKEENGTVFPASESRTHHYWKQLVLANKSIWEQYPNVKYIKGWYERWK